MMKQYLTNNSEYFPMLAQEAGDSPLSDEEARSLWAKLKEGDVEMSARLLDAETPDKIYQLAESLHIPKEKAASISVVIRDIGLGTLRESDVSNRLHEKLPELSQEALRNIQGFIREFFSSSWKPSEYKEDFILGGGEDTQKPKPKTTLDLPLLDAMRKFPRLGQQRITSDELQMRGSRDAVAPSVKNWITIYQQETGPAPHEAFERSNFLFHNANAVKLSQEDRNKLHEVLTSLDNNTPLAIDIAIQRIQFSNKEIPRSTTKEPISDRVKTPIRFEKNTSPEPPDILDARFSKRSTPASIPSVSPREPELRVESETPQPVSAPNTPIPSRAISSTGFEGVKPLTPAFSRPSDEPSLSPANLAPKPSHQTPNPSPKPIPSTSPISKPTTIAKTDQQRSVMEYAKSEKQIPRQIPTISANQNTRQSISRKPALDHEDNSQASKPHGLRITSPTRFDVYEDSYDILANASSRKKDIPLTNQNEKTPPSTSNSSVPAGKIRFSSSQTFPGEDSR
jgi:hypothetical protein